MSDSTSPYVVLYVEPGELSGAAHQPPGRKEMNPALNALKKSIADIGLQYPPLVVRKLDGSGYVIADGHRRVAAVGLLNWPKIPVIVTTGKAEKLFSAVSGTSRPISANQWIYVFLNGGVVPSGPTRVNINRLDDTMGRDFLQQIYDAGMSPQIWSVANRVVKYMDVGEDRRSAVLEWLVGHKGLTRQVSAWMSGSNQADELRKAFEENREPVA